MPTYRVQTDTGIFMVESPTPITSDAQMQQALNAGGQGLKVTSEAPEQPVSQGFLQKMAKGFKTQVATGGAAVGVRGLLGGNKPLAEMTPEERRLAQSPLTVADVGRLALPFLVGRMIPAGRTATRIGGQILGNVVGSAALEGGQEAIQGKGFLGGAMKGAMQGLPSGVTQGVLGGVLGPNKATLKAQQASTTARFSDMFSTNVRKVIPQDPKAILSAETVKATTNATRADLDAMESTIHTALAPQAGLGQKGLQAKFDFLRERVKILQDIGDQPRTKPELAGSAKRATVEAATLNRQIITLLKTAGREDLATLYDQTLRTHAKDRAQIRVLKAIQRTQNLPGGVNRADNPETAEFVDALKSPQLGPEARTAFAAFLFAMRHPLIAIGQLTHPGGRTPFIDPQKVQAPRFGKVAGPLGAGLGSAASLTVKDEPE